MSEQTVIVQYKTEKRICSCCYQKLPEPKTSKVMKFEISKEGAMQYVDWNEIAEYPEDVESLVPEYVRETIEFHATSSNERVIVENSEIEKVKDFILNVVVKDSTE